MELTTLSKKISDTQAVVEWQFSGGGCGVIECNLEFSTEDSDIVCELAVIKHLFDVKKVTGSRIKGGKGVTLVVSKGAIKKMLNGRSEKNTPFINYLNMVLDGCGIKVLKSKKSVLKCFEPRIEELTIPFAFSESYVYVDSPSIGRVKISAHAIHRYIERLAADSGQEPVYPLPSLVRRLQNPENKMVKLPNKVVEYKANRYGEDSVMEVWNHPTSTLNFCIVTNQDGEKVLATVYIRNNKGSFVRDN